MRSVPATLRRSSAIVLFLVMASPGALSSQPPQIRFRSYSVEQGLSQSQVSCILQDREGFIWLGTQDGLNRFDGYSFKVYRQDPRDSLSISDDYINCLFEDSRGALWVGTYNGGLNRYVPERDGFVHFVRDTSRSASLSGNNVWSVSEDASGNLWVGVWGGGLNRLSRADGTFTHVRHAAGDSLSLVDDRVLCQIWDRTGSLWVGTYRGLDLYDPSKGLFRHFQNVPGDHSTMSEGMVTSIFEDHDGDIWVGTLDNGLNRYDRERSCFLRYQKSPHPGEGLTSNRLGAVVQDDAGTLWVATRDGGMNLLDKRTGRITPIRRDEGDPGSLNLDAVSSLYRDHQGGIWIGTDGGGFSHYNPHRFKFQHIRHEPGNPGTLSHPVVRAICEERSGDVWVGMMEGNLDRLDAKTGGITHYRDALRREGLQSSYQILSIMEDSDGYLWVGTDGGGLYLFDRKRKIIRHLRHDPGDARSIPDDYVISLVESRDGALWIGGTSGSGLGKLNRRNLACERFSRRGSLPNQISGNYIWAILESRNGLIWLGTWGAGVSVLDPRTTKFRTYNHDPADPGSLGHNSVLAFHEDRSGRIWVGTLGGGLDLFDGGSGTFTHFTEADGLPNNTVSGILEDSTGRLWLSTNRGVSCFDPAAKTFRNYDVSDGLQSWEFNQGAFFHGRSGRMYFGGVNGVNTFIPRTFTVDTESAPLRITRFSVFDHPAPYGRGPNGRGDIVLSHDQNFFAFEFSLLDFTAPEKNRYRYRLEGFDRDWIPAGSRRYASYTNLGGGEYVFRVQGSNSDGVWSAQEASFTVRVLPPFWESLLFRALFAGTIVALGIGFYRTRVRRLKREHAIETEYSRKLNESQESERKRIAGELHDSLGQDLLMIRNSLARCESSLGSRAPGAEELHGITGTVEQAIEEVREISADLHPHMLDRLGLTKTIEATIRKWSESSGLRILGTIDDVDGLFTAVENINVFRIIQEGINNVVKHSHASECRVAVRRTDGQCEITIEDDGCGFDPAGTPHSASDRVGFGLGNMAERARFLHGQMQIKSAPGNGTRIAFRIPISHPAQ
ncbi:MAG TPA: two-component regulator propeller domain-containing protein [Bacteroidota bacterium]|nr:two-component regulator propeller domain-containing protein [Bacteroidota bacterium]